MKLTTPIAIALFAGVASAQTPDVRINELRIDNVGADTDEYFELAGKPGLPLDGLTYVVIGDGSGGLGGTVENATDLTGQALNAAGFFVCASATFTLGTADMTYALAFENSDNVTHMLVQGWTGLVGDDLDTNDDGVFDVTPWTAVLDAVGLLETDPAVAGELLYGFPNVGPDGTFVPGHVYRSPDGPASLSSWNIGTFAFGGPENPGAPNFTPAASVLGPLPQWYVLDAGPARAGDLYLVGVGASGTAPGLPVGTTVLPLNFDPLVLYSIQNANSPTFQKTFGTLDASGRALPVLALPVLDASYVGITLNTAGVVLDASFTADFATNATTLVLAP